MMTRTGSNRDYRGAQHNLVDMRRQADQYPLAQDAQDVSVSTVGRSKRTVRLALVAFALLFIIAGAREALAQGPDVRRRDAGGPPEPFGAAMVAYRQGLFDLTRGDHEQAVLRLSAAVAGIPTEVMASVADFQDMYWVLGEAQEAGGMVEDALASYQQWLLLVGDDAAPWTIAKVRQMEIDLHVPCLRNGWSSITPVAWDVSPSPPMADNLRHRVSMEPRGSSNWPSQS